MGRLLVNRPWVIVAFVLVLAFGIAGCEDLAGPEDSGSTSTSTLAEATTSTEAVVSTTTTSAPATTTPTTAVSLASSEELLPSGHIKATGFITKAWMVGNLRKLKIDYIDLFWDPEADIEALADGASTDGEWYARNNSSLLRTFVVSDTVTITTFSRDGDEAAPDPPCSWADFMSFWDPAAVLSFADQQIHGSKWFIERDGDIVVHIQEIWTP